MWQLFFFILFSIISCIANAITVKDDSGKTIVLSTPAKRIVTLSPDLTEIIFSIGKGDNIVGTVDSSDYPKAAKSLPRIGSYLGLDTEKILLLKPDLIITWGNNFAKQLQLFKRLGIPVYVSQPKQLQDVARSMDHFGCLLGNEAAAQQLAQAYLASLARLKQKYAYTTTIRVFFQLGSYSLLTVNRDSWINQAIQFCGGENIFSLANTIAPSVTLESIIVLNPHVILTDASAADWQQRWLQWQQVSAVKAGLLFAIPADWIDRPGPRLLLGVNTICQSLHKARTALNHAII